MHRVLPGIVAGGFVVLAAALFLASPVLAQCGIASYYCCQFHGRLTASGSRFNQNAMTAAHKTLPFGTIVQVTDQRTGNSVRVRIDDRGPFVRGRIIDLSRAAATKLGFRNAGTTRVCLERQ